MFRRIFASALGAGVAVGLLVALLQHVALVPLILEAEKYESGAAPEHKHTQQMPLVGSAHAAAAAAPAEAPSPWRAVLTTGATTLTSIGFALLLSGAFAVSGREVNAREGLLWGLAGFAALALAPAFGLPPELPGSVAADLLPRQVWWIGTVAATALVSRCWCSARASGFPSARHCADRGAASDRRAASGGGAGSVPPARRRVRGPLARGQRGILGAARPCDRLALSPAQRHRRSGASVIAGM